MVCLLEALGQAPRLSGGRADVDGVARRARGFGQAHAPYLSRVTSSLRAPLRPALIAEGFTAVDLPWPPPVLMASVGSTNAEALLRAQSGAEEGTCVVAEEQTAGRGRHRRAWVSPPGAGLWGSVVIDLSGAPSSGWGLLPLAAGLALGDAVTETTGLVPGVKWPNDLIIEMPGQSRKLAGILVEVASPLGGGLRAVVGMGINVDLPDLPPGATSLVAEGHPPPSRELLLVAELHMLRQRVDQLRHDPQGLLADIRAHCVTVGRGVRIDLPGGQRITARAEGIGDDGSLEVIDDTGMRRFVTAGDVIHATI